MKIIRVTKLLATNGKKTLQIYRHLPMTEEEREKPQEIIEKLEACFKQKRNVIFERYV